MTRLPPRLAHTTKAVLAAAIAAGLTVVPAGTTATAEPAARAAKTSPQTVTDGCINSIPDPGTTATVKICYTLFRPAGAGSQPDQQVPLLLHSHGWGGSRTKDPGAFQRFLDAGYGVLSFDQRGFGESGGQAYIENPQVEGHDVRGLVARISKLEWVRKDGPRDPRLGAIGGSYGGGYQFLAAFEHLRIAGKPVLDALAPEITWHDLIQSLAPAGVVRAEWALALTAAAVPSDALPRHIYKALVEGVATGQWPDGSVPGTENLNAFFEKNGPRWHVQHGRRLDIPVLLGQGMTDTLFNAEQALANWNTAITPEARERSMFVGYNGGHVLPAVFPQGVSVTSDPCSNMLGGGDFRALSLRFFDEQLKGKAIALQGYGEIHLATPAGRCITVGSDAPTMTYAVGTVANTTGPAGPAVATPIAQGPITVAGLPHVTADVTSVGVEARVFYGLAVGTSPADAKLVQNNVMPLREPVPVVGAARSFTLPAVAVDVPAGQTLYLLSSPVSDTFAGMSSRVPGVVALENTVVHLPVR